MKKMSKQITLGIDPLTGKRIRKRVYGSSKTDLERAEKNAAFEFGKHGITSKITFGEYRKIWLETYCSNVQPVTFASYNNSLNHMKSLDTIQMNKITRTDLQRVMNEVWDTPYVANKVGRIMGSIWRSAVIDGVVERNIADKIKRPKKPKSSRRALTAEELKAIEKVKLEKMDRFLVDLLLQFGLRPGEAYALTKKDFNRKEKTLTISKALAHDGNAPFIKPPKTGAARVLPVPDSFWAKIPKTKYAYFFADENNQLPTDGLVKFWNKRIIREINRQMGGTDKIKATDMTMYTFRHNKATQLYYLPGVSFKKKAEYMGHSEQMFLQTYSHLDNSREEIEALRNAQ